MSNSNEHQKLVIFWPENQTCRWISAVRATANYYGWTKEFEVWRPKKNGVSAGYLLANRPNRSGRGIGQGGKSIRICRSESREGYPATKTNQFTISNSMTTFDLAELAAFTEGDWYWMEDLSYQKVSKEHWDSIYRARNPRRGRGLVSD